MAGWICPPCDQSGALFACLHHLLEPRWQLRFGRRRNSSIGRQWRRCLFTRIPLERGQRRFLPLVWCFEILRIVLPYIFDGCLIGMLVERIHRPQ